MLTTWLLMLAYELSLQYWYYWWYISAEVALMLSAGTHDITGRAKWRRAGKPHEAF